MMEQTYKNGGAMESKLDGFLRVVSKILNVIGGTALTVHDVSDCIRCYHAFRGLSDPGRLRNGGLLLAVVIGFTIPKVSLDKGHVIMEFLLEKLSPRGRAMMITFTGSCAYFFLPSLVITFF